MALEMKVPKEITAYEAKPMFGMSWRRLGSLLFMAVGGGGTFAGIAFAIAAPQGGTKEAWEQATNAAMFVIDLPAAWWGWFRPMGLKPEIHALYFLRFSFSEKGHPVCRHLHTAQRRTRPRFCRTGRPPQPRPRTGASADAANAYGARRKPRCPSRESGEGEAAEPALTARLRAAYSDRRRKPPGMSSATKPCCRAGSHGSARTSGR